MPDFNPQYTYGTGAISASGHAGNIASTTPEEGMYSLINGALDNDNLDAAVDFDVRHFQLSEFAHFAKYTWRNSFVLYDQTVGGGPHDDEAPTGIGLRYYLPSNMDTVRIDYSFFLSGHRNYKVTRTNFTALDWGGVGTPADLDLFVVPYVNGSAITGQKIPIPKNVMIGITNSFVGRTAGDANHVTSYEHLTAQQYSGTFTVNGQSRGMNTFELRARLESPAGIFEVSMGRRLGYIGKTETMDVRFHGRLTWGAGCVTMRAMGMS